MTHSRELRASPLVLSGSSSQWLDSVNSYNELDPGTTSCAISADSLDGCLGWAANVHNGRPESPLRFDHDEVMGVSDGCHNAGTDCNQGPTVVRFRCLCQSVIM